MNRILYLAMPFYAYEKLISYDFIKAIIKESAIKIILFDHQEKIIIEWIE